ncbi:MAG: DUF3349 domain-containing protein [Mycobacterium sp.]|nr:DUF3349 domain-containing protein [Mycobacterium sp.]
MTVQQQQPSPTFLENVLGWLHKGYPEGVPRKDYYPLLALLKRSLSEDDLVQAAQTILRESDFETPVTPDQIRQAISDVIEKEPTSDEINQVAGRLAMVGWPLADHG